MTDLDLTKPIRTRDGHREARIVERDLPGEWPYLVVYRTREGNGWSSGTFMLSLLTADFENVPPPEIWGWMLDDGSLVFRACASAEEARGVARRFQWTGEPVRVMTEAELAALREGRS